MPESVRVAPPRTQRIGRAVMPKPSRPLPPRGWRKARGDVSCVVCGGTYIEKAPGYLRCSYCGDTQDDSENKLW